MGYMHIESLYKNQNILLFRRCWALEKVHGTGAHVSYRAGIQSSPSFFSGGENHDCFVQLFDAADLTARFAALGHREVTIYGEAYGGRQMGMRATYGDQLRFVAFDVQVGESWLSVSDADQVVVALGLEFVPFAETSTDLADLDAARDAPSVLAQRRGCGDDKAREGVVRRYFDVRDCNHRNLKPVEVICGGFPCQDLSDASRGRGGGIDGERSGLWRSYIRLVRELSPAIVIVENVGGAAARVWVPTLRRGLHVLGYRTRALRVDAADVGAPHRRSRVFVLGYANTQTQSASTKHEEVARVREAPNLGGHWRKPLPATLRMANGVSGGLDARRLEMLGDAVIPDMAELIGRVVLHDIAHEITNKGGRFVRSDAFSVPPYEDCSSTFRK